MPTTGDRRVPSGASHPRCRQWRKRAGDDAMGHAATATHRRPARNQHSQHLIAALARLAQARAPLPRAGQQLCRIRSGAQPGDIDADPAGLTILTGTAGAATQIKWIQTVITVFEHQTDFTEIKELLIWADDLRVDRNALAHGTWDPTGCEPGTCSVTTYNWQKTEVMKTWLITSSDLDELLSGIHEWIREYVRLGRKYAFPRVKGKPGSIFDHDD